MSRSVDKTKITAGIRHASLVCWVFVLALLLLCFAWTPAYATCATSVGIFVTDSERSLNSEADGTSLGIRVWDSTEIYKIQSLSSDLSACEVKTDPATYKFSKSKNIYVQLSSKPSNGFASTHSWKCTSHEIDQVVVIGDVALIRANTEGPVKFDVSYEAQDRSYDASTEVGLLITDSDVGKPWNESSGSMLGIRINDSLHQEVRTTYSIGIQRINADTGITSANSYAYSESSEFVLHLDSSPAKGYEGEPTWQCSGYDSGGDVELSPDADGIGYVAVIKPRTKGDLTFTVSYAAKDLRTVSLDSNYADNDTLNASVTDVWLWVGHGWYGSEEAANAAAEGTAFTGDTFPKATPSTGYSFTGWYDAASDGNLKAGVGALPSTDAVESGTTWYAHYDRVVHKVTLDPNVAGGGKADATNTDVWLWVGHGWYGSEADASAGADGAKLTEVTFPQAAPDAGYSFTGWYGPATGSASGGGSTGGDAGGGETGGGTGGGSASGVVLKAGPNALPALDAANADVTWTAGYDKTVYEITLDSGTAEGGMGAAAPVDKVLLWYGHGWYPATDTNCAGSPYTEATVTNPDGSTTAGANPFPAPTAATDWRFMGWTGGTQEVPALLPSNTAFTDNGTLTAKYVMTIHCEIPTSATIAFSIDKGESIQTRLTVKNDSVVPLDFSAYAEGTGEAEWLFPNESNRDNAKFTLNRENSSVEQSLPLLFGVTETSEPRPQYVDLVYSLDSNSEQGLMMSLDPNGADWVKDVEQWKSHLGNTPAADGNSVTTGSIAQLNWLVAPSL